MPPSIAINFTTLTTPPPPNTHTQGRPTSFTLHALLLLLLLLLLLSNPLLRLHTHTNPTVMSAPRRRQGVFLPMSIVVALSVALALGTLYTYEEICSMAMEMQPIQTLALHLTSVAGLGGDTASSKSAPPRQQTPIVVRDLTVTMQWDDQCFASLFADPPVTRNGTTDAETIAETCNCKPRPTLDDPDDAEVTDAEVVPPSMEELSRTIAFVEDNDAADANKEEERQTIVADAYPKAVSWRIKSEGVVCGDILDATLLETHGPLFAVTLSPTPAPTAKPPPETTSSEETGVADPVPPTPSPPPTPLATRAIPALVTAQGDGTYTVSATLPAEGDYELLVRACFIWSWFYLFYLSTQPYHHKIQNTGPLGLSQLGAPERMPGYALPGKLRRPHQRQLDQALSLHHQALARVIERRQQQQQQQCRRGGQGSRRPQQQQHVAALRVHGHFDGRELGGGPDGHAGLRPVVGGASQAHPWVAHRLATAHLPAAVVHPGGHARGL